MTSSTMEPTTDASGVDPPVLTARSVIATALLGARWPSRLSVAELVLAGSLFGISDTAIRTALSRMVAADELTVEDRWYGLAGQLLERQARVDAGRTAARRRWNGTWDLAIVRPDRRSAPHRQALRSAATALHLGEIREGVWGRPDNLDPNRLPAQLAVLDEQCHRLQGAVASEGLAGDVFDIEGWAATANRLLDALRQRTDAELANPADLTAGFRLSIDTVRHLQGDPLLPDEVLPSTWPGADLRLEYGTYDRRFKRAFRALLDAGWRG